MGPADNLLLPPKDMEAAVGAGDAQGETPGNKVQ